MAPAIQSTRPDKSSKRKTSSQQQSQRPRSRKTMASAPKSTSKTTSLSAVDKKLPLRSDKNNNKSSRKPTSSPAAPSRGRPAITVKPSSKPTIRSESTLMFPQSQGTIFHAPSEPTGLSQLTDSQGSTGWHGVSLGQKSYSQQSSSQASASILSALNAPPPRQFGIGASSLGFGDGSASQKSIAPSLARAPPRPPLAMGPPKPGSRGFFGSARSVAYGNRNATTTSFLPLEYSTLGPNHNQLSFLHASVAKPPLSGSQLAPSQSQQSVYSAASMPSQSQQSAAASFTPQHFRHYNQGNSQASQEPSFAANIRAHSQYSQMTDAASQKLSHSQTSAQRSMYDSQTHQVFAGNDTSKIERMTKEVSDDIENKAKSIMDKLTEKEESVDKKAHDWEMQILNKADAVTETLDNKASVWETKMTDYMTTMKTIESIVKNESNSVDMKIASSESMFKKHEEMLDNKAKEIHQVGSKFLGKITKMGDNVVQVARDARESLKITKSDIVKSILSRLDAPIASMLRKAVVQHESMCAPLASVSPSVAVLSSSAVGSKTGTSMSSGECLSKAKSADPHLPTPLAHKSKKMSPSHPSPLNIHVVPKRCTASKRESSPSAKVIKTQSSALSCITPSDMNKKSGAVFTQESFMTSLPDKRLAGNAAAPTDANKRRRVGTNRRGGGRGRGFVVDTSQLGFMHLT